MSVHWVGVLEDDPQVGAGGIATVTLAAGGELLTVSVSGGHACWVARTISAGLLVEVEGETAGPGVMHAWRVQPWEPPAD
jgi:hypothetical protein